MAKVVAPITASVEVIGKPRESSYEAGSFYYPTLFIDLLQPEGVEIRKIWKNLSSDEVSQIKKGDRVQLIPAGKDKNGKDKHNIVLLDAPAVSDSPAHESTSVAEEDGWSPEQKRAMAARSDCLSVAYGTDIAAKVQQHSDLLRYCLEVATLKFGDLVPPEDFRPLGITLYLSAIK